MTIPLASVAPRLYVSGKSHVAVPACAAVTVAPTTGTPAPVRTANRILAIAGVITGRAIYQGTLDEPLKGAPGQSFLPAWSPDGTRLAFTSTRDGNSELYVMNRDGSGLRRLTNSPAIDSTPTWSPTGTQIAFTSDRDRATEGTEQGLAPVRDVHSEKTHHVTDRCRRG